MGTSYNVKLVCDKEATQEGYRRFHAKLQASLDEVNSKMSHYLEDSEISQLNRAAADEPVDISPDTIEVLQTAERISDVTGGAFDVTVAPFVNAWGFGPPGRPSQPTAAEEIQTLLDMTGWRQLVLDTPAATLTKKNDDLVVDLSAIAKGFGVDRVAEVIESEGFEHFMVEVGGEIRTRGLNDRGEPWRIGIERPLPGASALELIVPLTDLAMATSGDYRNYWEVDGKRISHTIDPRTGYPIDHNVASVSVVHSSCTDADAYATALLVLGPDGMELAEDLGLAAYFLERGKGDVFVGRMTSGFRELVEAENDQGEK